MPRAIRRFRVTTDSRNTQASPNLLKRAFQVDRPNRYWVSDITFIPTREGWLYLAVILDLYSRAVVGWAMSKSLDCRLAAAALNMAIERRGTVPAILHSDQGATYAAAEYRALLSKYGIRQSMSRKANCWDNAPMESFFHTLKSESVMHYDYRTRDQARGKFIRVHGSVLQPPAASLDDSLIHYVAPLPFEISTTG